MTQALKASFFGDGPIAAAAIRPNHENHMGNLWIPTIGFPVLFFGVCLLVYIKMRSDQKKAEARLLRLRQKREQIAKHGEQPTDEIIDQPTIADIQGLWRMVSVGKRGRFAPPEVIAKSNILFTISDNHYVISPLGTRGQLVVDASHCPASLDQHEENGDLHLCIIRIRNGELEICQADIDDARPNDFNPNRRDNASLTRFERAD